MTRTESVLIPVHGAELEGELRLPDGARAVAVFAHGAGSDRKSPRNGLTADALNREGVATLLFDLLTPEEKQEYRENVFDIDRLSLRLIAAARWVMAQPSTKGMKIGFVGASTGAAAALNAAATLGGDMAFVVSRGGRPDLADQDRIKDVQSPTRFIIGGNDLEVIEASRAPFERLSCEKTFELVAGATHVFEEPGTLEKAVDLTVGWVVSHI